MKKLYLHIGTEKTGTTSIQHTLFTNRAFLEKSGYHFLQCAGKKNNRAIPASCIADSRPDEFLRDRGVNSIEARRKFRQELLHTFTLEIESLPPSVHSVIISSEFFHSRNNALDEVENVYDFLSPFFSKIKVICYLREQSKVSTSHYSTALKSNTYEDFAPWVNYVCKIENPYYNYYAMLKNWALIFGKENLCVRFFDKKAFVNNDLIDDFFTQIDKGLLPSIIKESNKNESITTLGQFLLCASNKVFAHNNNQKINTDRVRAAITDLISHEFSGGGQCVTAEKYDEIYKAFHASNVLLNKEFFDVQDGSNCFAYEPPENTINTIELNDELFKKITNIALGINEVLVTNYAGHDRELFLASYNIQVNNAQVSVFIKGALHFPALCMPMIRRSVVALFKKGYFARCEKTLQYVLQKAPQTAWAYYLLSKINSHTKRYGMGMQNINKALELEPQNVSFLAVKDNLRKKNHSKK